MKQHVTPIISKLQLRSTECYSWDSVLPLIYETYVGDYPSFADFNGFPTNIMGGYMFGKSCWAPLLGAMISPHQLIKPGRDTVDLQCDLWWIGAYQKDFPLLDPAISKGVGWAVQMSVLDTSLGYNQVLLPTAAAMYATAAEGKPEHPMMNPQVNAADSDGHIDWKYDIPINTTSYGTEYRPIVKRYLDDQWAVGYESTLVAKPTDFPEILPYGYPIFPFQMYKTPIRMVLKKNNTMMTDPTYTFKGFRGNLESPNGIGLQIFRLNGACDGVFQQGTFGTDDHPAEFSNAPNGLMNADPDNIAPIFVGIEMKVL